MKVWLDSNYNIVRDDGCNKFTKGNNLYGRIIVHILTESIANDNTLPSFNFLLSNGRKYGPLVYNVESSVEDEYTLFTYELTDNLLASEGPLQITITINWYNSTNNVVKTKNVNIVGNVIDSVVVADNIIIVGNEEGVVRSLVEDMASLDKRLTDGLVAIDRVDKDSQGNVIHETYETKADAETEYSDIRSTVQAKYEESIRYADTNLEVHKEEIENTYETKEKVLDLINDLKKSLIDGTIGVSKANQAEYYQEEDATLTSIRGKFADVMYLINELANTDLSGLLVRIQVLEAAWNKFMSENGDTADVIDTLNEIQDAIQTNQDNIDTKVDKVEGKSLIDDELIEFVEEEVNYNLFDSIELVQGTTDNDGKPTSVGEATRVVTNDFVSVEPNKTYSIDTNGNFLIYEVNYFDSSKNNISLNTINKSSHTFTTPSNCYYVIVLFRKDNDVQILPSEVQASAIMVDKAQYRRLTTNDVDFLKEENLKSADRGEIVHRGDLFKQTVLYTGNSDTQVSINLEDGDYCVAFSNSKRNVKFMVINGYGSGIGCLEVSNQSGQSLQFYNVEYIDGVVYFYHWYASGGTFFRSTAAILKIIKIG